MLPETFNDDRHLEASTSAFFLLNWGDSDMYSSLSLRFPGRNELQFLTEATTLIAFYFLSYSLTHLISNPSPVFPGIPSQINHLPTTLFSRSASRGMKTKRSLHVSRYILEKQMPPLRSSPVEEEESGVSRRTDGAGGLSNKSSHDQLWIIFYFCYHYAFLCEVLLNMPG